MILRKCTFLFLLISLFVLPAALLADSVPLAPGHYILDNHPDGGAAPPLYGLRLDGLYSGTASDIYTFSFAEADGAHMEMWIDNTSIVISGTVWGGKIISNAYDDPSFYTVHFEYDSYSFATPDDDVVAQAGSGYIQKVVGGSQIDLVAYAGGHPYTFRFGDEDNDLGHREFDGLSGWGWLNHSGWEHKKASDWIFTAHRVPEPTTLLLLSTGLLVGAAFRKRLY